jgi:hypothetical protein
MRASPIVLVLAAAAFAQDPGREIVEEVLKDSGGRVRITFQERVRVESRTGLGFGRDRELENPFFRTRIGAQIQATPWMKFGVMGQDARAPGYGAPVPGNARDPFDLHEAYMELFGNRKTGWGGSVGRRIIGYGEQRLLGAPDWGHTGRTFDAAQVYYSWPGVRLEALFMSVVPVRPDAFNRPVLSDRVWGMYNRFGPLDAYLLRHDFDAGKTTTVGGRGAGPIGAGLRLSVEAAAQNGSVGPLDHGAFAWHSAVSRAWDLRWPVELTIEYNYASGSEDPARRSGTFDQLYPANHEKYGQADLFGWRNIHHVRTFDSISFRKLTLRLMYSSYWLASPRDALYNLQGRPIARSPLGTAGQHVGMEADIFATYPWRGFLWGAGFAHFFGGEFVKNTTPGVNPRYVYFFQTYSF